MMRTIFPMIAVLFLAPASPLRAEDSSKNATTKIIFITDVKIGGERAQYGEVAP